jgi:hypothetical protein
MSRRSVLLALTIVVLLAGSVGTVLVLLLQYEPHHHRTSATPAGDRRVSQSKAFCSKLSDLLSEMNGTAPWWQTFTDEQVNSYLNEGFIHQGLGERLLPEGIREPRVFFEPDRMRLSFRYRSRFISTIVSVTLRIWLPKNEPNVVAVCLERIQAGLVPYSAHWLLEHIAETARQNGIEVTWYRHEGYPVALLRFQADQPRPTLQLTAVRFQQGSITIHGQSNQNWSAAPAEPRTVALLMFTTPDQSDKLLAKDLPPAPPGTAFLADYLPTEAPKDDLER